MLEALVVIVLVGIVGATSVGKIHSILVQNRVRRAANSLQTDLQGAFRIASRNRSPVRISWNSSKRQVDVTDRTVATYYRRVPLGTDYGLSSSNVSFSRSALDVYPNGFANDTLTITLTVESSTKKVRMGRTGMVIIQ